MSREPHFILGLDLGQSQDYSALVLLEQALWIPSSAVDSSGSMGIGTDLFRRTGIEISGWVSPSVLTEYQRNAVAGLWHTRPDKPPLSVPYMKRWQLGTPYPTIVQDVVALLDTHPLDRAQVQLVVDYTGCGRPVVDELRQAGLDWLMAVTIHAGFNTTISGREASVPKRDLIAAVTVLLEQRRLKISDALPEAAILERELQNFRRRTTPAGNETMASWRDRDHDDTVLALALAAWFRERQYHHFDALVANRRGHRQAS